MFLPNKKHSDAHLYEIALKEIREGTYDSALMSKAMTKAKGDQTEGQVMYVEWRVVILEDQEKKRKKEERQLAKKQAKLNNEKTEEEYEEYEEEQEFDSDKPEDKAAEYDKQRKAELAEEKREAKELKQEEKRQRKAESAEEKRKAEQLELEEKRQQAENKKNRLKSYDETVCTKCGRVNPSASELKWFKIFNCQYCNKENEPINYRDIYGIFHRAALSTKNFWLTNLAVFALVLCLLVLSLFGDVPQLFTLTLTLIPLMLTSLIISIIVQLFLHPETRIYRARRLYFRIFIILVILYIGLVLNQA